MDTSLFSILGTAAFGLLVIVTLGIGYLTVMGWRDRQRREQDRRVGR
jgi:septal ring factor EnvC (AmiA/AmiB activator)